MSSGKVGALIGLTLDALESMTQYKSQNNVLLIAAVGLLHLCATVRPCTIFEFADSGFAANAIHLMHAVPIFDGNNGTFFLDNTQFAYKCEEGGGWHDFFAYQDHLVPWSAAKERAGGEDCVRHSFRGVDDVLHVNLKAGWEPYNAAGVSQVSSTVSVGRLQYSVFL